MKSFSANHRARKSQRERMRHKHSTQIHVKRRQATALALFYKLARTRAAKERFAGTSTVSFSRSCFSVYLLCCCRRSRSGHRGHDGTRTTLSQTATRASPLTAAARCCLPGPVSCEDSASSCSSTFFSVVCTGLYYQLQERLPIRDCLNHRSPTLRGVVRDLNDDYRVAARVHYRCPCWYGQS